MKPINELEKKGNLYHATPIWKVEYILEDGLRADLGEKHLCNIPYQCITPYIRVAIEMAWITKGKLLRSAEQFVLGIVGFSKARLPENVREQLREDPFLYEPGLITFMDFPPESIDQVIVANLIHDNPDTVVEGLCRNSKHPISLHQIKYEGRGKFVSLKRLSTPSIQPAAISL